jgi:hypothetical protein
MPTSPTNAKLFELLRLPPSSAGVLMALALLVAVVVVALFRALAGLGQELAVVAPAVWAGLVSGLTWLVLGMAGLFGVAVTADLIGLAWRRVDRGRRLKEVATTSGIPPDAVMNGASPRSEVSRICAEGLRRLVKRPGPLPTTEIAMLRAGVVELHRDPGFAAEWNSKLVGPLFVLARAGHPTVLGWLNGYLQQREKRPFNVVLRLLHVLTLGRWGRGRQDIWVRPDLETLLTDLRAFARFTREYLYPFMVEAEALLSPGELVPESQPPPPLPEPEPPGGVESKLADGSCGESSVGEEASSRCPHHEVSGEEEAVSQDWGKSPESRIEEIRRALAEEEPWHDPKQMLSLLRDAADEALADHPRPGEVETLLGNLEYMQSDLSDFDHWFAHHTENPADNPADQPWPLALEKALWACRDEPHAALFRAHAVRLYLTGPEEDRQTSTSNTTVPGDRYKEQPPRSTTGKPLEGPNLIVLGPEDSIPEVKPSDAEFLF